MRKVLFGVTLLALVAAGVAWWRRGGPPEADDRRLMRVELPRWVAARSNHQDEKAAEAMAVCQGTAKKWPEVAQAIAALDGAFDDEAALDTASHALNEALARAQLAYWTDPQWLGKRALLTTYDLLSRAPWKSADAKVEALHVRRLDGLNLELGLLGHAGGDAPAVLRDRVESYVMEVLRKEGDAPEEVNPVDTATAKKWREQLGQLVGAEGVAEAERRLDRREQLLRTMESRLKDGKVHVAHPERLVFGDAYFESLEPYTSTRRRGGPLLLASDLRALRHADEALADSQGLQALLRIIEIESKVVEAHEVTHALDKRPLEPPELLQRLVGMDDVRFGKLAERELRAFIGQLRWSEPPACLSVVALVRSARGSRASSTPHFFAAHALLTVLADVDSTRGVSREQAVQALETLCALPDAELRERAARAMETLYGVPMVELSRFASSP